ncbi:hypothetical protein, conserved [Eimeria tenella]|uniref:Transmembrane protein n=1 Tax=Eimeria tenella TaxID=5802 RepID=U6KYB0_EIMTE|nr:hypothetical protein, conserved [Eimeria tenella]CDJ43167.1 hypothetical protein, conserved [Eimeria tenella]|eukprot:XP_013233917.1 hypothetical protein, conserved [Eimeria tenella]
MWASPALAIATTAVLAVERVLCGAVEAIPQEWQAAWPAEGLRAFFEPSKHPDDPFAHPETSNGTQETAERGIIMQPSWLPPPHEIQQEGRQKEIETSEESPSPTETMRYHRGNLFRVLNACLFIMLMAFIAKVLSTQFEQKAFPFCAPGAVSSQSASSGSARRPSESRGATARDRYRTPEGSSLRTLETEAGGQSEQSSIMRLELHESTVALMSSFKRAARRVEAWAKKSEAALLSGRAEGGGNPSGFSASRSLAAHVSAIASSLAHNVNTLCSSLEVADLAIRNARTVEQVREAASRMRKLLRAVANIGENAASEFAHTAELTTTMTSQARTLLDLYPEISVVANSLSAPLLTPGRNSLTSPEGATEILEGESLDQLKVFLRAVDAAESYHRSRLQWIVHDSFGDSDYEFLTQLLSEALQYQEEMLSAVKSLINSRRFAAPEVLFTDREVASTMKKLQTIKTKEASVGEALKRETSFCVERAMEHLEAGRILLAQNGSKHLSRKVHPLLALADAVRKNSDRVEELLTEWERRTVVVHH